MTLRATSNITITKTGIIFSYPLVSFLLQILACVFLLSSFFLFTSRQSRDTFSSVSGNSPDQAGCSLHTIHNGQHSFTFFLVFRFQFISSSFFSPRLPPARRQRHIQELSASFFRSFVQWLLSSSAEHWSRPFTNSVSPAP